jgi:D-glycero-alpha-D-manno-heptose-7-phosphate kinase
VRWFSPECAVFDSNAKAETTALNAAWIISFRIPSKKLNLPQTQKAMIYRSKAPLRIGLAGGGTDVSPYSDLYGGAILNATISMYSYATIEPLDNGKIEFVSIDQQQSLIVDTTDVLTIDGTLDLLKGVYNRVIKDFIHKPLSFRLSTFSDAPSGSGLGSSSTMVVAILGAFVEWLKLPLGEYDIAHLAFEIERKDLSMSGGKQDQYAATFGGFNFMEFYAGDKVIVNPLRVRSAYRNELSHNILLYYTQTSRLSSKIIETQSKNVTSSKEAPLQAMHEVKKSANEMKEAVLTGNISQIGPILHRSWQHKKAMAEGISNDSIDVLYDAAIAAGSTGGKISGAGGGGYIFFYCPVNTRFAVAKALSQFGGSVQEYSFTEAGLTTWSI